MTEIHDREEKILDSLRTFYQNIEYIEIIKPIIEGNDISLRVLDWFVTNYSKEKSVIYPQTYRIKRGNKYKIIEKSFEVWSEYKSQLKLYSKDMFDPFCRLENENTSKTVKKKKNRDKCKQLIRFYYGTGKKDFIETTMGQLNFFRWVITNKILDYIKKNINEIERDMNITQKESKELKKAKKKDKKKGIKLNVNKFSVSAFDMSTDTHEKFLVKF